MIPPQSDKARRSANAFAMHRYISAKKTVKVGYDIHYRSGKGA
jgi:hypothetical protein